MTNLEDRFKGIMQFEGQRERKIRKKRTDLQRNVGYYYIHQHLWSTRKREKRKKIFEEIMAENITY